MWPPAKSVSPPSCLVPVSLNFLLNYLSSKVCDFSSNMLSLAHARVSFVESISFSPSALRKRLLVLDDNATARVASDYDWLHRSRCLQSLGFSIVRRMPEWFGLELKRALRIELLPSYSRYRSGFEIESPKTDTHTHTQQQQPKPESLCRQP